jgi:hypothetical protein
MAAVRRPQGHAVAQTDTARRANVSAASIDHDVNLT